MGENSHIEWTKHTFNPHIGCTKVGPGCDHCYAEAWDARGLQQADTRWGPHAAFAYRCLWDHINGPGAWALNPWVVAYSFTVQRGNIDQVSA